MNAADRAVWQLESLGIPRWPDYVISIGLRANSRTFSSRLSSIQLRAIFPVFASFCCTPLHNRLFKKPPKSHISSLSWDSKNKSPGGGSRTHTGSDPRQILSLLRLPVPPLRESVELIDYEGFRSLPATLSLP